MTDPIGDINELVARKLGWVDSDFPAPGWFKRLSYCSKSKPGDYAYIAEFPDYSTSIEAAWEICEKWQKEGRPHFSIGDNGTEGWFIQIEGEGIETFCEVADTAPLAICKAFLKLNDT